MSHSYTRAILEGLLGFNHSKGKSLWTSSQHFWQHPITNKQYISVSSKNIDRDEAPQYTYNISDTFSLLEELKNKGYKVSFSIAMSEKELNKVDVKYKGKRLKKEGRQHLPLLICQALLEVSNINPEHYEGDSDPKVESFLGGCEES